MASTHFDAELERVGKTSARLRVPVDLREIFGRARPPLKVTLEGHTSRRTCLRCQTRCLTAEHVA